LPLADGVAEIARQLDADPPSFAATAGEDYELCACVPPTLPDAASLPELGLTLIGRVVEGRGGVTFTDAENPLSGFEHSF
jgi:thiamine-monophosphate kinase